MFDRRVSELNGTNGFTINGAGSFVSDAGDVNGDGWNDLLVIYQTNESSYSRTYDSYIVFSSPNVGDSGNLDLTNLDSSQGIESPNAKIRPAGDWNGDGFDDLFVDFRSSYNNYIVFSGSGVESDGILERSELNSNNSFATTIQEDSFKTFGNVSIGDVNGDGFDDIALADRFNYDNPGGIVYVIFGGTEADADGVLEVAELDGSNGFAIPGIDEFSQLGFSISSAGDFNGDGVDDFIVGAPYTDKDPYYSYAPGASYVILGDENLGSTGSFDLGDLDGSNGFRLQNSGLYVGFSVSSAGDFNGDGFDDVVMGSPGLRYLEIEPSGNANIVFGGSDVGAGGNFELTDLSEAVTEKGFSFDRLGSAGYSVSDAGDINGDGFDDILVGAPKAYTVYQIYDVRQTGVVYLIFGTPDVGDPPQSTLLAGETSSNYIGEQVSGVGDINQDGFDDFIVGSSTKESYVVFGKKSPDLDLNGSEAGIDGTVSLPDGETSVLVAPEVSLKVTSTTIVSAKIAIADSNISPEEFLSADTSGTNISASYYDRVLTLNGVDSVENYQQVLRTVRYHSLLPPSSSLDRTLEFIVDDGAIVAYLSPVAVATVTVPTTTKIEGTSGMDVLTGTSEPEIITGFQGADYLSGGGGRDRFVYTDLMDVGDAILDFEADKDVIDLSQLVDGLYPNSNPYGSAIISTLDVGSGTFISIDPDAYTGDSPEIPVLFLPGISADRLNYGVNLLV